MAWYTSAPKLDARHTNISTFHLFNSLRPGAQPERSHPLGKSPVRLHFFRSSPPLLSSVRTIDLASVPQRLRSDNPGRLSGRRPSIQWYLRSLS
ncbi:hypothetical protein NDI47_27025 [Microcoleus vaginatus GB1-A2]|uniref:hypothetical protein n=1 Tax=Microcoleus vaginatus TaxID=119532 RepID=UPI001684B4CC|nr:hypothetical protein [Microcoleus sp. FACHB-61]